MATTGEELGAKIKKWRKSKNLSQIELSKLTGIDQAFISRVEPVICRSAQGPITDISKALNITVTEFIEGPEKVPEDVERSLTAAEISTDKKQPAGLRALAEDEAIAATFSITNIEWYTLASIDLSAPITKDAYIQLLVAIRAALANSSVTKS